MLLEPFTSPTAVLGGIMTVIINAVYGHTLRWYSHIINEILKGMPPLTNLNTPTAIIRPTFMVWVVTALMHRLPSLVQISLFVGSLGRVMFSTTTTSAVTRNKMSSGNSTDIPAIAHTLPKSNFIRPLSNISDCNQFPKTLPSYINAFSHNYILPPKIRYVNTSYFNTDEDGGWYYKGDEDA